MTRPVLIGREAELGRVRRALDTARAGGSDVLVLRGQPGIGKTALLRDAIERADGMTVLRTRGLEGEAELPFAGLAELCAPVLAPRERLPPALALRDHRGWLADAERALGLAGDIELLSALAMLSAGAARMTVPDVAGGRRPLEEGERLLDLGTALSLAPEIVALAAHGWLWIEESPSATAPS